MGNPVSTDLVLINRGGTDYQCTVGELKTTVSDVRTVFGRTGSVVAQEGDYTLNLLGDVDLSIAPTNGQALLFDGTRWKAGTLAGSGTVISVGAGNGLAGGPITTTGSLSIDRGTVDSWYAPSAHVGTGGQAHLSATTATAGFMSATDKLKLNGIAEGATATPLSSVTPAALDSFGAVGNSTSAARADHVHPVPSAAAVGALSGISGTSPISVSGTGTTRTVSVLDASTTSAGVVRLADATAIANATAGRVVDAAQLSAAKVTLSDTAAASLGTASAGFSTAASRSDHVHPVPSAAAVGALSTLAGTAPVSVSGTGTSRTIAVSDATTNSKGIVQLADATAINNGTAGMVVDAAQLKNAVAPNLGSTTPSALGTPSAGTSTIASRSDHVHQMPSAADVGALASLAGTAPISVTGTGSSRTIAVAGATTSAAGVMQFATTAEQSYDNAGGVTSKAATPAGIRSSFMPLDISKLSFLP